MLIHLVIYKMNHLVFPMNFNEMNTFGIVTLDNELSD